MADRPLPAILLRFFRSVIAVARINGNVQSAAAAILVARPPRPALALAAHQIGAQFPGEPFLADLGRAFLPDPGASRSGGVVLFVVIFLVAHGRGDINQINAPEKQPEEIPPGRKKIANALALPSKLWQ